MKNRLLQVIFGLLVFLIIPFNVHAGTVTVKITCPSTVYIGETVTCDVKGTHSGFNTTEATVVGAVQGDYASSAEVSIVSFDKDSIWQGDAADGLLTVYTDKATAGNFNIGKIKIKGVKAGRGTVTLKNIIATGPYPDYEEVSVANASASFTVKAATTRTTAGTKKTTTTRPRTSDKKSTTTTRPRTSDTHSSTTTTRTTDNSQGTTSPSLTTHPPLKLSSVTVDDFNVTYEDGKYYVTVDYMTESVTVSATAATDISIIGTGERTLVHGKNVVDLILRDTSGYTSTVQVVITRPEDGSAFDTTLADLKVVNYDIKYEKGKTEFTVTVPFNTKEVYVIAKGATDNVIITGDGLQTLSGGKQDIYVRVSYGNLQSTEYKITVKKSYGLIIMWVLIAGLGGGIVGLYFYFKKNGVALAQKDQAAANKEKAMANRQVAAQGQGMSLNGEKNAGIGRRMVAPTPVAQVKTEEPVKPVGGPSPTTVAAPSAQKQVVVKKEPVQVAASAPDAQVRLVKTVTSTPNGATPNGDAVKNS